MNDLAEAIIEIPRFADLRQPVFDGIQPADNKLFVNNDFCNIFGHRKRAPAHISFLMTPVPYLFAPERRSLHSGCDTTATNTGGTRADTTTGAQSSDSIAGTDSATASTNPFANLASLNQQLMQDIQSGASPQQFDQDALALVEGLVTDLKTVLSDIGASIPADGTGAAPTDSNNTGTGSWPSTDAGGATTLIDTTPTAGAGTDSTANSASPGTSGGSDIPVHCDNQWRRRYVGAASGGHSSADGR